MVPSLRIQLKLLVFVLCFSVRLEAQIPAFQARDFHKADSVAALYPRHSLVNLKNLADKLTKPLSTDTDKFRAIYRWVCDNIENDYGLYVKNRSRREKLQYRPEELKQWNKQLNPLFFQKLLREHKTICTGYAYLLRELAFLAGLHCQIIDGYGRTAESNIGGPGIANHSWNAILLDNEWHLCDATWSSGFIDPAQKKFIKQFNNAYFLTPPSLFVRNHYPLDSTWILLKDKPTLQEFLNGPLIYKRSIQYQVLPIFPRTFRVEAKKGSHFTFRFIKESKLKIEKVELQLVEQSRSTSAYPIAYEDSNGLYTIDYVFTHKGSYVVHVLLNDDYVLTYTVEVSK